MSLSSITLLPVSLEARGSYQHRRNRAAAQYLLALHDYETHLLRAESQVKARAYIRSVRTRRNWLQRLVRRVAGRK